MTISSKLLLTYSLMLLSLLLPGLLYFWSASQWQEAAIRSVTGDPDRAVELLRLWRAATDGSLDPQYWWWRPLTDREDFRSLTR